MINTKSRAYVRHCINVDIFSSVVSAVASCSGHSDSEKGGLHCLFRPPWLYECLS